MFKKILIYVLILAFLIPNTFGSFAYAAFGPRPPETTPTTKTAPTTTTASTTTSSAVTTTTTAKPDPNRSNVSGTLYKEDGAPLGNALILLFSGEPQNFDAGGNSGIAEPSSLAFAAKTAPNGNFNFQNLPVAYYLVWVSDDQRLYNLSEQSMVLGAAQGNNTINLRLGSTPVNASLSRASSSQTVKKRAWFVFYFEMGQYFKNEVKKLLPLLQPYGVPDLSEEKQGELIAAFFAKLQKDGYFFKKTKAERLALLQQLQGQPENHIWSFFNKIATKFEQDNNYIVNPGDINWRQSSFMNSRVGSWLITLNERLFGIDRNGSLLLFGQLPADTQAMVKNVTTAASLLPLPVAMVSRVAAWGIGAIVKNIPGGEVVIKTVGGIVKAKATEQFVTAVAGRYEGISRAMCKLMVKVYSWALRDVNDWAAARGINILDQSELFAKPGNLKLEKYVSDLKGTRAIAYDDPAKTIGHSVDEFSDAVGLLKTKEKLPELKRAANEELMHRHRKLRGVYSKKELGVEEVFVGRLAETITASKYGTSAVTGSKYTENFGFIYDDFLKIIKKKYPNASQKQIEKMMSDIIFNKSFKSLDEYTRAGFMGDLLPLIEDTMGGWNRVVDPSVQVINYGEHISLLDRVLINQAKIRTLMAPYK